MAGNKIGGLKAAETNKRKYGDDFFVNIGKRGGKKGKADGAIKGFAAATPEQRAEWGRVGGKRSRRTKV